MDIILRTEEHFRIRIGLPALLELLRRHDPPDATAWEFCELVRKLLDFPPRPERFSDGDACSVCGYCLRGLEPAGRCPECGTSLAMEGAVESVVRQAIAKSTGISATDVTPDTLLVKEEN